MKNNFKLGIIGGMGPAATITFMKLILDYTNCQKDQDNVNMVVLNDTTIPDRTQYIFNKSNKSPLEFLKKDIKILENSECTCIVIACNTAHYWYNELQEYTDLPIINIISVVAEILKSRLPKKVGIIATSGTIKVKLYNQQLENIKLFNPPADIQKSIDSLIYDKVKCNKKVSLDEVLRIINYFKSNHCDCVIFGCTELSVIKYELGMNDDYIIDALEEVAKYIKNI